MQPLQYLQMFHDVRHLTCKFDKSDLIVACRPPQNYRKLILVLSEVAIVYNNVFTENACVIL